MGRKKIKKNLRLFFFFLFFFGRKKITPFFYTTIFCLLSLFKMPPTEMPAQTLVENIFCSHNAQHPFDHEYETAECSQPNCTGRFCIFNSVSLCQSCAMFATRRKLQCDYEKDAFGQLIEMRKNLPSHFGRGRSLKRTATGVRSPPLFPNGAVKPTEQGFFLEDFFPEIQPAEICEIWGQPVHPSYLEDDVETEDPDPQDMERRRNFSGSGTFQKKGKEPWSYYDFNKN